MAIITIEEFTPSPPIQYTGLNPYVRGFYSNDFVSGDGEPVMGGDGQSGFYYNIACSIDSDGNLVVPAQDVQATTDSNPTAGLTYQLYEDGAAQNVIFSRWQIPTQFGNSVVYQELATYNAARQLLYPPSTYLTAAQTVTLFMTLVNSFVLATDVRAGVVYLSTPADIPTAPYVWGQNDPLVRDAVKLRGISIQDFTTSPPSDQQLLGYNLTTDQWKAVSPGFGTGNVISNEVSTVDGTLVVMAGTGGQTIRNATETGSVVVTSGVTSYETLVTREVPTGTIDGVNDTFTLANTPVSGSESVYVAGSLQNDNAAFTQDYVISGATITFQPGHLPQVGNTVLVSYRY